MFTFYMKNIVVGQTGGCLKMRGSIQADARSNEMRVHTLTNTNRCGLRFGNKLYTSYIYIYRLFNWTPIILNINVRKFKTKSENTSDKCLKIRSVHHI